MKTYQASDQDLIRWIGTFETETEVNQAGYWFGVDRPEWRPEAGEIVVVRGHGKYRRGVVLSVGRLRAKVQFTTLGAVDESRRWNSQLNRTTPSVAFGLVAGVKGSAELVDGTFSSAYLVEVPVNESGFVDQPDLSDEQRTRLDTERLDPEQDQPVPVSHPVQPGGSLVVHTLERVWAAIRTNHADLPSLVMVTGTTRAGSPRWGHFVANVWSDRGHQHTQDGATTDVKLHEMFVAGETLTKGAAYTVETILHEAAHVLAVVRGVQDTSRQKRWHNQKFRALGEELGLEYPEPAAHPQIGYSEMLMTPGTRDEYAGVIAELDTSIRLCVVLPEGVAEQPGAGGEHMPGGRQPRQPGTGQNSQVKAVCQCDPPRIIRASRKVLDDGQIMCGICIQLFTVPADKN